MTRFTGILADGVSAPEVDMGEIVFGLDLGGEALGTTLATTTIRQIIAVVVQSQPKADRDFAKLFLHGGEELSVTAGLETIAHRLTVLPLQSPKRSGDPRGALLQRGDRPGRGPSGRRVESQG